MAKKGNSRRSDGLVAVSVYIGKVDGKKKYKTFYGKTQKEANAKAEAFRNEIGKAENKPDDISFRFWADKWSAAREVETSEERAAASKSKITMFVNWLPFENRWLTEGEKAVCLGDMPIDQIKLYQLQAVLDALARCNPSTGKPSAKRTLNTYLKTVQAVFDYALFNQVIAFDPTSRLTVSKTAPQKERRALSKEERQRICEFDHNAQLPAMLMTFAGLRRGEVTALLWSDIDFDNKSISITKSYDFKANRIKPPKTEAGVRTVPMPDILCKYLQEYRKGKGKGKMLVVLSAQGKPMTESAWKRMLESYHVQLNYKYGVFKDKKHINAPKKLPMVIEPFTWHCLRHTYATILYESGVDAVTAKDLLGHSDIKTTLGIYTHLSAEKKQSDISKLNTFLGGGNDAENTKVGNGSVKEA